jgi:hypothetical protein
MAQIWEFMSENGLAIIGLVIAAITAVGVFYGPRLVAKRQERKEKLRKHFDDLKIGAIEPLTEIIASIGIKNGSIITRSPQSFDRLDSEQLECFQAHYPAIADKWQELAGKWTRHKGLTGGRWARQNEKAKAFENKIEKLMSERLTEAGITLPIKPYRVRQELIVDGIPETILKILYDQAQGGPVTRDFNKAAIIEDSDFYILEVAKTKWAASMNRDIVEKCKAVLADIQKSLELREEASSVIKDAEQIEVEFQELLTSLDKIQSRGFISKDPKYKFQPVKKCLICKELFY